MLSRSEWLSYLQRLWVSDPWSAQVPSARFGAGPRMPARLLIAASLVVVLSSCSPIAWLMSAHTITPSELARRLTSAAPPAVLDLREKPEFTPQHVPGSSRVDYAEVGAAARVLGTARELVLVCEHGNLAALAVPSVRGVGHERVVVFEGGLERWVAEQHPVEAGAGTSLGPLPQTRLMPSLPSAIAAYAAGVVIKPTYMLMSLGLILWLRKTKGRELRLLRRGLAVFLFGETACLFNFYLSDDRLPLQWLEALHGLGMAVGSGFMFYGIYAILETRVLDMNDSQRSCALNRLCAGCTRQKDVLCRVQRQLRHVILFFVPVCALPWTVQLRVRDSAVNLFGTMVEYRWPILNQFMELRLCPTLAFVGLLLAWFWLRRDRRWLNAGHWALFFGLGLLSFACMRGLLDATFTNQPYWADIWEEATELAGISTIAVFLWVFRASLLRHPLKS